MVDGWCYFVSVSSIGAMIVPKKSVAAARTMTKSVVVLSVSRSWMTCFMALDGEAFLDTLGLAGEP